MPRQRRKQATVRAGAGESTITRPASPVAAYPPYVQYINVRADRSKGANELRVGEALQGFGRTLADTAVKRHAEDAKKRRLRGQADALKTGAPEDWSAWRDEVMADPERGDAYMQAYGTQAAKLAAVQKSASLADELNAREDITDEGAFNDWFAKSTQKDIEAFRELDDMPEAQIQYLAAIEAAELKMRGTVKKRNADMVYEQTERDFNMVARSELEMINERGAAEGELKAWLTQKTKDARELGLSPDDTNEALVRHVGEMAVDLGEPEVLDVFAESHPDVTGEGSVPGLLNSSTHGPKIRDYRKKAVKERDALVNEALKRDQWEQEKAIADSIREGNTESALAMIDSLVAQDPMFTSRGVALRKEALKTDKKEARIAQNLNRITLGDTLGIAPEYRKETMTAYGDRQIERAGATGDSEALWEARKDIAATGGQIGMMYPADEAKLKKLNLVDPEAFAEQMTLFDMYRGVSPTLLNDMPNEARDLYSSANRMIESGIPQDQIMLRLQELQTPEAQERRRKLAADSDVQDDWRKAAGNVEARKGLFNDIEVEDLLTAQTDSEWIRQRALDYAARTGTEDMDEAIEVAKEDWQNGFGVVDLPDGTKQSYYKGNGMPANLDDMIQWGSDGITEELKSDMEPDNYWMLMPDPASRNAKEPQFIVRDKYGRLESEVRNGLTVPKRVGLRELQKQWSDTMTSETEEQQKARQAERAEGYTDPYRGLADDFMPPFEDPAETFAAPEGPYDPSRGVKLDDLEDDFMPPFATTKAALPPALSTALDRVKQFEAFRAEPYFATEKEKARGLQTIGYGRTSNVTAGMVVSKADEEKWLAGKLQDTADRLEQVVGPQWDKLNPNQQAAVLSLAYNVDVDVVGQFLKSKSLAALKRGDYETFKREAFDPVIGFVKQEGEILPGLVKRRRQERELFDTVTVANK